MARKKSRSSLASSTERAIAGARVILAASSLFAVWLDPAEPARFVELTYTLQAVYVAYSVGLAMVMWNQSGAGRLPIATHIADIVLCSVFQYLTLGPSSPFFMYFVFSLFCGALRWGWSGTFATSIVVTIAYLGMGAWMSRTLGPTEFELNRFIIRTVYLAVLAVLLVYLGQHEVRLRSKIEQLARWPMPAHDATETLGRVLEYALRTLGAGRVFVVWDVSDEPWLYAASWPGSSFVIERHPPAEWEPVVAETLETSVLFCLDTVDGAATVITTTAGEVSRWQGNPIHPTILGRLGGQGLASAPFRTERVSGRVFFSDLNNPTAESAILTEAVARSVGESIDQMQVAQQLRELGAREQRVQLARDLHDGVLQSLTGVRFELRGVARGLTARAAEDDAGRVLAAERALASEQRELRYFIDGLQPERAQQAEALEARLLSMRERVSQEWRVPITMRFGDHVSGLPSHLNEALPFMAQEAIVNALKHGHPSRVSLDVDRAEDVVRLIVTDDGSGFPFLGRHGDATLKGAKHCPLSLYERTHALGGRMCIESTDRGSRVEIALPVSA